MTDVIILTSGLQYRVLRKGEGTHHPTTNSPCQCHYEGMLIDGTMFDSSYKRGKPSVFKPNQVSNYKQYIYFFFLFMGLFDLICNKNLPNTDPGYRCMDRSDAIDG